MFQEGRTIAEKVSPLIRAVLIFSFNEELSRLTFLPFAVSFALELLLFDQTKNPIEAIIVKIIAVNTQLFTKK